MYIIKMKKVAKTEGSGAKTKQKQKQTQNVKQTVIIRLDKEGKRKAVKRRKRMPKKEQEGASSMQRSLPAAVTYQSSYAIPYPVFKEAPKVGTIVPEAKVTPILEDIGQVGTEGRVTILDKPTKKEQLGEMLVPVDREKDLSNQFLENEQMLKDTKNFWQKTQEEFNKPAREPNNVEKNLNELANILRIAAKRDTMPAPAVPKTRRNREQMAEARQMEREDIASINLGLAQFNPTFKSEKITAELPQNIASKKMQPEENIPSQYAATFTTPQIQEDLPTKTGPGPIAAKLPKETLTESTAAMSEEQNIPESVLKKDSKPREGSWAYLLLQFKQITGQEVSEYKAKKEFKTKEAFAARVDELNRQK